MLYVLAEPVYRESIWCNEIISGIKSKAKEKKVTVSFIEHLSEITEAGQLILVATSIGWFNEKLKKCKALPVKTVAVTPKIPVNEKIPCSFVGSDNEGAVVNMVSLLKEKGKNRIALYGVNSDSVNDLCKKNCFVSLTDGENNVFYNNGNVSACFEAFFENAEAFDAVLCTNSYAAFHLVNSLKTKGFDFKKLFIISLSDSRLLQFSSPAVTAVDIDYRELGKAAFDASKILYKNPALNSVNMAVEWKVAYRQTTNALAVISEENGELPFVSDKTSSADVFYNDNEISELMLVENLLEGIDSNDLKLLCLLKEGKTYEHISKELFVSESGIKYKLKKFYGMTNTSSKEELLRLLEKSGIEL